MTADARIARVSSGNRGIGYATSKTRPHRAAL